MNEVVEMSATLLGLLGLVEIAQVLILALKYLPFLCFIYVKLFSSNSTEATSIGIFMEKKSRFSIDSDADTSLYVKDRRNAPAKKSYTEPTSIVLVMFHCGRRKTAYHWPTFFFFLVAMGCSSMYDRVYQKLQLGSGQREPQSIDPRNKDVLDGHTTRDLNCTEKINSFS